MANFEYKTVLAADTKIYEITVSAGDSFDKIAKAHGSTTDVLQRLNPGATLLHPGQVLKYQKASAKRIITNWRQPSMSLIAQRYNGGRDPNYAKKLDYAMTLLRARKTTVCVP